MTIEFRCQQCGRLLRTGDDTVGKQAKCPACQFVQVIPAPLPPTDAANEYGVAPVEFSANPFAVPPPPGAPRAGAPPAAPASDNPYASPVAYGTAVSLPQTHGQQPIVPTPIDLGLAFSRAWEMFKANAGFCIGATFLFGVILYGVQLVPAVGVAALEQGNANPPPAGLVAFQLGSLVVQLVVNLWLQLGTTAMALGMARGGEARIGALFSGGRYFLNALLSAILYGLIVLFTVGLACIPFFVLLFLSIDQGQPSPLAIAGMATSLLVAMAISIYLGLRLWPWRWLLVDRDLGPVDALTTAWRLTPGNLLSSFLLWLVASLMAIASMMVCCLPVFIGVPVAMLAVTVGYLMMSGQYRTDAAPGITP